LIHFNKEFGLDVPWVAAVQRIPVPSQMLARHELAKSLIDRLATTIAS
jgi:hypothetical protein